MSTITLDDLRLAYKKLKHYFFLDTSALDLRYKIAEWEQNLEENLGRLFNDLQSYLNAEDPSFRDWKFDYYSFPKNIKSKKSRPKVFINMISDAIIERGFYFIDAPIEVHIISVLWCIKVGPDVENNQPNIHCCFGNRLKRNNDLKISMENRALFEPFFVKYNGWRDNALIVALDSLNKGKDIALLNLDISSFYDSVRLGIADFERKPFQKSTESILLTRLLSKIHHNYAKCRGNWDEKSYALPIGLLSSGILANWYLRKFDQAILNARPIHYGRYVDDLLIVFEIPNISEFVQNNDSIYKCLEKLLPGIFEKKKKGGFNISGEIVKGLSINTKKCSLFLLDHSNPKSLLTMLQQDIKKNSSGFKFLPDEDIINTEFENNTGSLLYREAESGKICDVHGLIPAKFKITQFLAKHIFFSHNLRHKPSPDTGHQMIAFFKGARAIENHAQWERVLTYLYVNEFLTEFLNVYKNICKSIKYLTVAKDKNNNEPKALVKKIQKTLEAHLKHCLILCRALDPTKWDIIQKKVNSESFDYRVIRKGGMVRHKYMPYPILAASQYAIDDDCSKSLIQRNAPISTDRELLNADLTLTENYPAYIHLHDLALKQFWKMIRSDDESIFKPQNFEDLVTEYNKWNKIKPESFITSFQTEDNRLFHVSLLDDSSSGKKKDSLCVALANIKVEEKELEDSLCFYKKVEIDRQPFDKIFNQITEFNSLASKQQGSKQIDIVVFPELAMPFDFLYGLCKQVRKSNVGVVTGLTYIVLPNKKVLNVEAVILPITIHGFREALPILRIKNYNAPHEREMIENHTAFSGDFLQATEPPPEDHYYHLINWRGLQFTVFNCYELTNIKHRSLFSGKIDCLIATEFNKDVPYFSSIVESASRDLHCFVIQSNNAKYGDSRICAPYKREEKDIIQIKGGKNPTILVEDILISELREFQSMGFTKQQKDYPKIKPTPAGFERSVSNKRLDKGI